MCRRALLMVTIVLVGTGQGSVHNIYAANDVRTGTPVRRLPDTGQRTDYSAIFGEDSDYLLNAPSFSVNGDGTVTDNITGLMWQQADGGEMTFDSAMAYCDQITLGTHADWRLPTSHELFGIVNHDRLNPALDTSVFRQSQAQYWWSSDRRVDDSARVWVVNAGGGIGPHPKNETISAGGTLRFHIRAVREAVVAPTTTTRMQVSSDSTVTDQSTGLVWQRFQSAATMTWEQALEYSESLWLEGYGDWRLPNIKELQSLNEEGRANPSVDPRAFPAFAAAKFWSSTTQYGATTRAWYMNFVYGIATYESKPTPLNVVCVRGGGATAEDTVAEAHLPGGTFEMGDHYGFVDPSHPSDELPVHTVRVNAFVIARTELTNRQACDLLNGANAKGLIEVRGDCVLLKGRSDTLLYLNGHASYSSIGWSGSGFAVVDFRADHPIVGVMWSGAAALCNWLSVDHGLQECYDLSTWICNFLNNGYRLPTEAEWEYAARGGQYNPYLNYPWGNDQDVTRANWPGSGDPYETGAYPYTTPVGFYDGALKLKAEFNWPGSATSYQTSNGANAFGLFDMAGNVWEFVNDWYGNTYYSISPSDNPKGPDSGFIMPDGKPYRGMRGGNWYNGYTTTGINDGHSRVSNRNPSYYRGPQDPNHPWYHVGFRVARNAPGTTEVGTTASPVPGEMALLQNYPNPFNASTTIQFSVRTPGRVRLSVCDVLGREVDALMDEARPAGTQVVSWNAGRRSSGMYLCRLTSGDGTVTTKMVLTK